MNLKSILKTIKMHESSISTLLGFVIIVIIGLLIVNYFRQANQGETIQNAANTAENQMADNTHKVVAGDTLWSISEKYYGTGFEWKRIMEANDIKNANDIEEGQVLNIPEVIAQETTEPVAMVTEAPTAKPEVMSTQTKEPEAPVMEANTVSSNEKSYTVVHGDNLWKIAVAVYGNGYKWTEIAKANKLAHPGLIHAGNVLVLPR